MKTIKDLKKSDKFSFNSTVYTVSRKWINGLSSLIAYDNMNERSDFYYEGLEVEDVSPTVTKI